MLSSRSLSSHTLLPRPGSPPVEWVVSPAPVDYERAVQEMERRADAIAAGLAAERVWLLEHPPLYTAGTSAKPEDLLEARFPVFKTGRGGQFTYHGPGQRVAYVMLDLKRRRQDVRAYVCALESWLIAALAEFGVKGETRAERVGVWVARPDKPAAGAEDKIAAIGVRIRRWATFHGLALNVEPELSHFRGIVPCGIAETQYGVTSFRDLGLSTDTAQADAALRAAFTPIFGATIDAASAPNRDGAGEEASTTTQP